MPPGLDQPIAAVNLFGRIIRGLFGLIGGVFDRVAGFLGRFIHLLARFLHGAFLFAARVGNGAAAMGCSPNQEFHESRTNWPVREPCAHSGHRSSAREVLRKWWP